MSEQGFTTNIKNNVQVYIAKKAENENYYEQEEREFLFDLVKNAFKADALEFMKNCRPKPELYMEMLRRTPDERKDFIAQCEAAQESRSEDEQEKLPQDKQEKESQREAYLNLVAHRDLTRILGTDKYYLEGTPCYVDFSWTGTLLSQKKKKEKEDALASCLNDRPDVRWHDDEAIKSDGSKTTWLEDRQQMLDLTLRIRPYPGYKAIDQVIRKLFGAAPLRFRNALDAIYMALFIRSDVGRGDLDVQQGFVNEMLEDLQDYYEKKVLMDLRGKKEKKASREEVLPRISEVQQRKYAIRADLQRISDTIENAKSVAKQKLKQEQAQLQAAIKPREDKLFAELTEQIRQRDMSLREQLVSASGERKDELAMERILFAINSGKKGTMQTTSAVAEDENKETLKKIKEDLKKTLRLHEEKYADLRRAYRDCVLEENDLKAMLPKKDQSIQFQYTESLADSFMQVIENAEEREFKQEFRTVFLENFPNMDILDNYYTARVFLRNNLMGIGARQEKIAPLDEVKGDRNKRVFVRIEDGSKTEIAQIQLAGAKHILGPVMKIHKICWRNIEQSFLGFYEGKNLPSDFKCPAKQPGLWDCYRKAIQERGGCISTDFSDSGSWDYVLLKAQAVFIRYLRLYLENNYEDLQSWSKCSDDGKRKAEFKARRLEQLKELWELEKETHVFEKVIALRNCRSRLEKLMGEGIFEQCNSDYDYDFIVGNKPTGKTSAQETALFKALAAGPENYSLSIAETSNKKSRRKEPLLGSFHTTSDRLKGILATPEKVFALDRTDVKNPSRALFILSEMAKMDDGVNGSAVGFIETINSELAKCGFAPLDPRTLMDLVVYLVLSNVGRNRDNPYVFKIEKEEYSAEGDVLLGVIQKFIIKRTFGPYAKFWGSDVDRSTKRRHPAVRSTH